MERRGFTLVELMVVLAIIAALAALITPALLNSRTAARNAAIKAEIDSLHMALMNYRNEYGSFPPCADANPTADGPPITSTITSAAQAHLKRIFPRCTTISGSGGQFQSATAITPANALASWLQGYTGNPLSPLAPAVDRKRLFDFDDTRISGGLYAPAGKPLSPYIYINSAQYGQQWTSPLVLGSGTYRPVIRVGTTYFNPDTFQILCAGLDEQFGTDDDLSNFWKSTRVLAVGQ